MMPILRPSIRNYNNVGTRNNGFQYKIMPLSFNLQLKGNTNKMKNKSNTLFNIGDQVYGTCIYDNKTHTGIITNIIFSDKTNKPYIIYIMDSKTRLNIALNYITVKKTKNNIFEYKRFNFDETIKKINESIFDDDIISNNTINVDINNHIKKLNIKQIIKEVYNTLIKLKDTYMTLALIDINLNIISIIRKNNNEIKYANFIINDNETIDIELYRLDLSAIFIFILLCKYKISNVFIDNESIYQTVKGTYDYNHSYITISNEYIKKIPKFHSKNNFIIFIISYVFIESYQIGKKFIDTLYNQNIYTVLHDTYNNKEKECQDDRYWAYCYNLEPVKSMKLIHKDYILHMSSHKNNHLKYLEIKKQYNGDI